MNVNIEVAKTGTETTSSLIRRFTKRVQGSGIIQKAKSLRYSSRPMSKYTKKKMALKRLTKRREIERLKKLGKIV